MKTIVRPKYGMVKSFDPNGTDFTKDVLIEVNTGHILIVYLITKKFSHVI